VRWLVPGPEPRERPARERGAASQPKQVNHRRRNVAQVHRLAHHFTRWHCHGIAGNNAESDPKSVLAALNACNASWVTPALQTCVGYVPCDNLGRKQYKGQIWALGERGYSLFNTIVPPNSK
jgi:hypothetical protein